LSLLDSVCNSKLPSSWVIESAMILQGSDAAVPNLACSTVFAKACRKGIRLECRSGSLFPRLFVWFNSDCCAALAMVDSGGRWELMG
jgi:hypothetical protein